MRKPSLNDICRQMIKSQSLPISKYLKKVKLHPYMEHSILFSYCEDGLQLLNQVDFPELVTFSLKAAINVSTNNTYLVNNRIIMPYFSVIWNFDNVASSQV